MTIIRNEKIDREDFVFFADRIVRWVCEEGLNYVPCMLALFLPSLQMCGDLRVSFCSHGQQRGILLPFCRQGHEYYHPNTGDL